MGSIFESWDAFFESVDDPAPDAALLGEAKKACVDAGFTGPKQLRGLQPNDMDALNLALPLKAFLRRALRVIVTMEETSAAPATTGTAAASQPGQLLGPGLGASAGSGAHMSAAALALQLGPSKEVNVVDKLKSVDANFSRIDTMPFHMVPEAAVWTQLQSENDAAASASRTAFSYVDLTAKEWLPLWIAPDAVGGKTVLPGDSDWLLSGDQTTATLSAFGRALQQATQAPRFFRNLTQWIATFQRYALVAEAMSQFSRKAASCHLHTVLCIAEEERIIGGSPYLAILTTARPPIASEVQQTDKAVLASARSRLEATLQAAGLRHTSSPQDTMQRQLAASSLTRQNMDMAKRGQQIAASQRPALPPPQRPPVQPQSQQYQPQQHQQPPNSSPSK
eukprot:6127774-Amphidinium_carterae.1